MGCSYSGFVLCIPVHKGGCEDNERCNTRIKHIFKINTGFVKGDRKNIPNRIFWNTLVLSAVIPDTETF